MPTSHLPRELAPRTPCNKFVYDFPCDFLGIVGGYGLRHMCSHFLRASCDFFHGASGATRGKSVQRLCGDCTEIVQCQCSCRAVSPDSAWKSYGARAGIGLRTVPVQVESLYKESSAMRGLKVWKQNGVQILSIEKTHVLTMHE